MRVDHPIFNTPHDVDLTIAPQPTPPSYASYPEGRDLGQTMPMWRVQTEGYQDGTGQPIGMVSRDAGFLDSPDVEWISSGASMKGPNAVAIGRHGNFFHWGFASSPTYLTDEAKLVLVNAIHYIARFDGCTPVARKVQGARIRSTVDSVIENLTDEGYARLALLYDGYRADGEKRKDEIRARIDAGEDISDGERRLLDAEPLKAPGRLDGAKRLLPSADWNAIGEDPAEAIRYLESIKPYLYPAGDWYALDVDEEARELGLANDDPAFLARIATTADEERSKRLLARYTEEAFESAEQWKAWHEENAARFFFSEAAGYKWLVDTRADERARRARGEYEPPAELEDLRPTERAPLAWDARIERRGDGTYEFIARVEILPGWHAYGSLPPNSPYKPLDASLELPDGLQPAGNWSKPAGHPAPADPGVLHVTGSSEFRRALKATEDFDPEGATVRCTLGFQVCDESMCMRPTSKTKSVPLPH